MQHPYSQLYVHLVWATWDRLPLLTAGLQRTVYACFQAKCRELRSELVAIGGTETHAHLLARIPTTLAVATLAQHVKGASSHLANHELAAPDGFKWQGAYGAFSVSKADVPRIREYILNQEQHHRDGTLDEELEEVFSAPNG
jgi:REP element-mobilizing transposase RayT